MKRNLLFALSLTGSGRASMVCLEKPLKVRPGEKIILAVKEVRGPEGAHLIVPGHKVRRVF